MSSITYTRIGDYLLPNITLSNSTGEPLGLYGQMHKEYLRKNKPALYSELLLSERLYPLCREVDRAAKNRLATIRYTAFRKRGRRSRKSAKTRCKAAQGA